MEGVGGLFGTKRFSQNCAEPISNARLGIVCAGIVGKRFQMCIWKCFFEIPLETLRHNSRKAFPIASVGIARKHFQTPGSKCFRAILPELCGNVWNFVGPIPMYSQKLRD